jgi:hypothetical protein
LRNLLIVAVFVVFAFLGASWFEKRQAGEAESGGGVDERGLYDCTCDYLTDTDLSGQERVRVCSDDAAEGPLRARGCAQRHSPGSVSRCTCVLHAKVDCAANDCRLNR